MCDLPEAFRASRQLLALLSKPLFCYFFAFYKNNSSAFVALEQKVLEAFAGKFGKIAHDGKPKIVVREFLEDLAQDTGSKVEEFRHYVFLIYDHRLSFFYIAVCHEVQHVPGGLDRNLVGYQFGDYIVIDKGCLDGHILIF